MKYVVIALTRILGIRCRSNSLHTNDEDVQDQLLAKHGVTLSCPHPRSVAISADVASSVAVIGAESRIGEPRPLRTLSQKYLC